jgi:hypothetical protein
MYGLMANWISIKIKAKTNAPTKVAIGENESSVARLKKYETTLTNPTKTISVIRIVVSIVPLSWLRFAISELPPSRFRALKA